MAAKNNSRLGGDQMVDFRYSMGIMKARGDKAGLAKAKKEHPAAYADWEKRQAKIDAAKKSGKK